MSKIIGECGDCGHPIYADGSHNKQCQKPSEKAPGYYDHLKYDDNGQLLVEHGGSWRKFK